MKKLLFIIMILGCILAVSCNRDVQNTAAEKIQLNYLAWNLGTAEENNLERRMLSAFQEAYPNVSLTVLEVPRNADGSNGDYGAYLNTLASQANLPDVYMWTSVTDTVASGWLYNITEYADRDPEFQRVIAALRNEAAVNGHVYAVPYAAHLFGMAVNLSILDELNVPPLPFSYTIEDLQDRIARTTTNRYKGVDNFAIEDWGAFTIDSRIGFATFDGTKYNFSSPAYARSIAIYREIVSRGQTGNGSFTDNSWLPEGVGWAWGDGYIAFQYEATWSLPDFVSGARPFNADLMPLPGEKVVLVPDFIYIAANTKNPQPAYELAKWMSFGEAGQKKRVEIARANGFGWSGIPLTPGAYPEVDNFFLQNYRNLRNFLQVYEMISAKPENAILEGYKVVPGFARSRFEADTGILGRVNGVDKSLTMSELVISIIRGERQLADYAAEMDRIANRELQSASDALRNW